MLKLRTTARLSVTIGLLAGIMVWVALQLNLVPSPHEFERQHRAALTKSMTLALGPALQRGRVGNSGALKQQIERLAQADGHVKCLVVRNQYGKILQTSDPKFGRSVEFETAPEDLAVVEYESKGQVLGKIEVHFHSTGFQGLLRYFSFPYDLLMFTIGSVSLATWLLFSRVLKYLNPSNIVPQRVRSAFDTLTEGVVLVNKSGAIVHSNQAFQKIVGCEEGQLLGDQIGRFNWKLTDSGDASQSWLDCVTKRRPLIGQQVNFTDHRGVFKFSVNASPIVNDQDVCRGAIISFDDITESEKKREQLSQTIATIELQNEQLYFLASYDSLTECLNRAPFLELLSKAWEEVDAEKLSVMMVDVDHFKSINDTYGHSVGDKVLKAIGQRIKQSVGDRGSVCRYGGEEFVVMIQDLDLERAVDVAHEIHRAIETTPVGNISVTVSVGFSNRSFMAMDAQHLIDQGDQCLYAAKHLGRNRVVRFDQMPEEANGEVPTDGSGEDLSKNLSKTSSQQSYVRADMDYSAAMGLLSALSFRSPETANHSLRVAKLAVKVGENLLNRSALHRVEMAALMHSIGVLGLSESILYKPGPLKQDELVEMRRREEIGIQIVRSTFASDEIAGILKCCQYRFDQSAGIPGQELFGKGIPVMSRIIFACDVFDTMVHEHPHGKGISVSEALQELADCSPEQFDPEIVGILANHIGDNGYELNVEETKASIDPRTAVAIGGHIERVYDVLESGQWGDLLRTTEVLREQANDVFATPLVDAIDQLRDAIGGEQSDQEISALASDMIDLCRDTRSALIDVHRVSDRSGDDKVAAASNKKD